MRCIGQQKTQAKHSIIHLLWSNIAAFNDTVHKNNLPLLTYKSGKKPTKSTSKICNLQMMCISSQGCTYRVKQGDSDMDAFFEHENHAWPPSLAANGINQQIRLDGMLGVGATEIGS